MPTNYIYGTVLTAQAVAANNRAESLGNVCILQKVLINSEVHTTVSAEAIRFAIRYRFQLQELPVNRTYDVDTDILIYKDETHACWNNGIRYIDDDIMGFMTADAAHIETGEDDVKQARPKTRNKATIAKRSSPLSVGRAVSLRNYLGAVAFNSNSGAKQAGISIHRSEIHSTEYQYSFGLNVNHVNDKANILELLDAIIDPPKVAGNHARFFYDFAPHAIVFRVTNEHSMRIQNCFALDKTSEELSLDALIRKIEGGDIPANELIVGGQISEINSKQFETLGVKVTQGTKAAATEVKTRISTKPNPTNVKKK